jgi:U1 small nuclear ribonucleoprotein
MTRYLPPNLLNLFSARPPIEYAAPVSKRRMLPYNGVSQFISFFKDPKDDPPPEPLKLLNRDERKALKRKEKQEKEQLRIEKERKEWDPHNNPKATDEAYKTLFVSRLSYNTSESKLKREFEQYGPIKQIKMVTDLDNKPRGYAFIEFERERDMRDAFKAADAKKIDERRILVDVERGRTVKDWNPRRFGGGLGGTRLGSDRVNIRFSGRQPNDGERRGGGGGGDDRRRDERPRDDRHRGDERRREERPREERNREERPREERNREERPREERRREDRPREDRHREDRHRDDKREDKRGDKRDDKRDDKHRDEKRESRKDDDKKDKRNRDEEDNDRNVRARKH